MPQKYGTGLYGRGSYGTINYRNAEASLSVPISVSAVASKAANAAADLTVPVDLLAEANVIRPVNGAVNMAVPVALVAAASILAAGRADLGIPVSVRARGTVVFSSASVAFSVTVQIGASAWSGKLWESVAADTVTWGNVPANDQTWTPITSVAWNG